MKKIFAFVLSLMMVFTTLGTMTFAAGGGTNVSFTVDKTTAAIGDTITVTVSNKAMTVSSFTCGVKFDKDNLECKSVVGPNSSYPSFFYLTPVTPSNPLSPVTEVKVVSTPTDANNSVTGGAVGFAHTDTDLAGVPYKESTLFTATFEVKSVGSGSFDFVLYESSSGTDKYNSDSIETKTVTVTSATSHDLPVAIAKPATGNAPETTISDTDYTGSITWTPGLTGGGKFAANTKYTANVTLTAKGEYRFASDVNPTVTDATSVTVESVAPDSKTLTFKATFPETGAATLKDIKIIDKIDGQPLTVAVPHAAPNTTKTNTLTLVATSVYDDGTGGPVEATWEITNTDPIPKGVSIGETTGKLTVTNEASAGPVRVLATSAEGYTDAVTVTITKEESKATAIVATAPATGTNITIPNGGSTPSGQCSYKVYDQYGAEMTGASATWKMEPETVPGVTFVSANGSFNVTNAATTCTVKLYAEGSGQKSNEITFNITREESKPHLVTITGADSVNVPIVHAPGADGWEHKTYTAEVKDQYNNVISNPNVEWSVTDATGVSIDDNGKLTVTNKANAGAVTITAKSGDASGNKDVTINKPVAKATLVKIFDQADGDPETSLHIPTGTGTNNVDYTAKVYDQYGVYMPGEMVHWALDPLTVTGVELDDTTVSGSATLKVDNTATSGTTFKLKATTATLGTTGVKELDITLTSKTPASVTTAPKAVENLKYTGDEQALVTEGAASGGTMRYSLDNGANWSTAVPTGKNADTYTVQYKVVGDSDHTDYTPTSNTVSVSIGQKEVTVSGITAANKVYDDDTSATVDASGATFTGKVDGDELTITATGTFADTDVDVGDDKTVTLTLGALGGTSVANYTLAATGNQTTTTANITPRDLTVTPEPNQSKKFGAEDPTLTFMTTGVVPNQTPSFTGKLSRTEGEDVGQYDITQDTLEMTDDVSSGFKASNYTLKWSSTLVKFEIKKADALKLKDITVSQKYTVTTEQSKDIGRAGMPEKAGMLAYAKGTESKTGSVKVDNWSVDSTTGKVSYKLSNGAAGDTVTLPVTITSDNYENSIVYVKIALTKPSYSGGGGSYTPSYTVSVDKTENGTITVSPKSASKGDTVTITVKPDKGYELDTLKVLDKDGDKVKLTEKNGKYTFKMPSGKVTVKGSFVEEAPVQIFKDVPVDAYYYEAVKWAAEKGITGGVGNGLFGPNDPCTRAQIVTFLWRAAGSPAPKNMSSFADVPADAFYAKAVAWAVENGITGGTGDGKFSPDATCTRAQSVTFLYRAAGSPKVSSSSAEFGDVATNTYYADAVAWAAKNGITGGIGGGLFGSNNDCTRAQIVTFLYRCVK